MKIRFTVASVAVLLFAATLFVHLRAEARFLPAHALHAHKTAHLALDCCGGNPPPCPPACF